MEEHQKRRKLKMTFETMMEGLQLANLNFVYVFVAVGAFCKPFVLLDWATIHKCLHL